MTAPQPYATYRPTGESWCARVPAHWDFVPLRRVGRVTSGGTPTADTINWDGDIPFMTPPDLRLANGQEVSVTQRMVTRAGALAGSSTVPAGSVVVSIRAPIGYVGRTITETAFNQGCRAITPDAKFDARYTAYSLIASRDELDAQGRGTTFMEVSGSQFLAISVPVPPTREQRAIADFLDEQTSRIDTLIAKQTQLIDTLRERRLAVGADVVTQGIRTDVEFVDSGRAWLGPVPSHWRIAPIWSMFRRVKDVGHPAEPMVSVFRDHGVVLKDAHDNLNKTAENRGIYQLVHPGWLLTNRMKAWQGSVGISGVRGITSGHYLCFEPLHTEEHLFLNALFRSPRYTAGYRELSRGVRPGQIEIDNDNYRVMPVVVPPRDEQLEIVEYLDEQTSRIDTLIAKTKQHIELARERRAALITAAVTGQIDVRTAGRAVNVGT